MELGVGDALGALDLTLGLFDRIRTLIATMKGNKERSERLSQRVKALRDLVLEIKQSGPAHISQLILSALQELRTSLARAEVILVKYSQTKGAKSLWKSGKFESQLQDVNERLNENFLTLSGALQAEHRNVLHKVYRQVSGGPVPQEARSGAAPAPVPRPVTQPPAVLVPVPPPGLVPQSPAVLVPVPPPGLVPQSPAVLVPVPPPGLVSPLQLTPSPFYFPPPPPPPPPQTITFTAPTPGLFVTPVPPCSPVSTQVVVSSTLSPTLAPVVKTYAVRAPFYP